MTKDGKELMATADSVFTKVTGDLLNGTILVGQLELIKSHVCQFLDIWELSEYPVELEAQAPGRQGRRPASACESSRQGVCRLYGGWLLLLVS